MRKMIRLAVIGLVLFVYGCAPMEPKITVEGMQSGGLLIAKLVGKNGWPFMHSADAVINGKTYTGAVKAGYIRLQLPPGNYQLQSVTATTTSGSSWGQVRWTTYHTTTHELKAKFTIKAGSVTNLGAIVGFYIDQGRELKQYFVDNTPDMKYFLRQEYPTLYSSLKKAPFYRADETYISKKQVSNVQKAMVLNLPRSHLTGSYAHSGFGIIAKLIKNQQGKLTGVRLINTGTYSDIEQCKAFRNRYACIVPKPNMEQRLFVTDGERITNRVLPAAIDTNQLFLLGKKTVVIASPNLKLYTSQDNGKSWSTYDKAILEPPPSKDEYAPTAVGLALGRQGYYVFSKLKDNTILYRPYRAATYQKISRPAQDIQLSDLWETSKGVYSSPTFTIFGDAKLLFLPSGGTQWEERTVPSTDCTGLQVLDYKKDEIAALCNKIQISTNSGITWRLGFQSELKQ